MPAIQTRFERLEFKFLIDETKARRVRDALSSLCDRDVHCRSAIGYPIESLYLDTPSFAFHEAKERGDAERLKLRVRTYRPGERATLEVKRRHCEVIRKTRGVVWARDIERAALGFGVTDPTGFSAANITDFARLVGVSNANPVLTVQYDRDAYESTVDAYARVTFDRRIRVRRVSGWRRVERSPWLSFDDHWTRRGLPAPVVLELKCETHSMPLWMSELVRRHQLVRTSFSKYSIGLVLSQHHGGHGVRRSRSLNAMAAV